MYSTTIRYAVSYDVSERHSKAAQRPPERSISYAVKGRLVMPEIVRRSKYKPRRAGVYRSEPPPRG